MKLSFEDANQTGLVPTGLQGKHVDALRAVCKRHR